MGILANAYHEVGHAYFLVKFRKPFRRVSIKKTPGRLGCTFMENADWNGLLGEWNSLLTDPSEGVLIALAGAVCEKIMAPSPEEAWDFEKALDFNRSWLQDLERAKHIMRLSRVVYSMDIEKKIDEARRSIVDLITQDKPRINRIAMALCGFPELTKPGELTEVGELTEAEVKKYGFPELLPAPQAADPLVKLADVQDRLAALEDTADKSQGRSHQSLAKMTEFPTANPPALQKRLAEKITIPFPGHLDVRKRDGTLLYRVPVREIAVDRDDWQDLIEKVAPNAARKALAPPRDSQRRIDKGFYEYQPGEYERLSTE